MIGRLQNLTEHGVFILEQMSTAEQHRSHIAVASFYAASALVASLEMAILLPSAGMAYAVAQSLT
jgi:hypothetical protein